MSVQEHKHRSPKEVGFAVITVSDTRNLETDTGGALAQQLIETAGYRCPARKIIKDESQAIQSAIAELLSNSEVQAIVLTGGTGISSRDVTPQTVRALSETILEGFGELFRSLSFQEIGTATILSRAVAGIKNGKPIFALPGSTKAVRLGLEKIILPEIGHILAELKR